MISGQDSVIFNHKKVDSLFISADRAFINDKFWLLVPFQLIWDKAASISTETRTAAPISKTLLNKITLTYPDTGGYTPGDAYDIFYNELSKYISFAFYIHSVTQSYALVFLLLSKQILAQL